MNIQKDLEILSDLKYKHFQEKIVKSKYPIMGVKIPNVRKLAKKYLKSYDVNELLEKINDDYFENIMLKFLIIANSRLSAKEIITLLNKNIDKIDNWAICDTLVSELKIIKNNEEIFLKYVKKLLKSKKEYYLRVGIVILNDYYITPLYLDTTLNILLNIKSDYYYVNMAISWTYTTALSKYFDETLNFLKINKAKIPSWVFNKIIEKGKDSYKISNSNKNTLQNLKGNS